MIEHRRITQLLATACVLILFGSIIGSDRLGAGYNQDTTSEVGALTSKTQKPAPDGTTPDTRTTVGLGEKVDLTLDSSKWKDTDENASTGAIESDTIGNRVWTSGGKCAISPTGTTMVDTATMTASFDPGGATVTLLVYDSGTKYNDDPVPKTMNFTVIKPSGETPKFEKWEDRTARFWAVLDPLSVCFGNINVKCVDGAGAHDDLWFTGSTYGKWLTLTARQWDVDDDNSYWFSLERFSDAAITYYRANPAGMPSAPNSVTLKEEMHVVEGSSGKYDAYDYILEIGLTTITTTRDSLTKSKTYP